MNAFQEKIDAYLKDLRLAKRPAGTISDKQLHFRLFTSLANKPSTLVTAF